MDEADGMHVTVGRARRNDGVVVKSGKRDLQTVRLKEDGATLGRCENEITLLGSLLANFHLKALTFMNYLKDITRNPVRSRSRAWTRACMMWRFIWAGLIGLICSHVLVWGQDR